MRKKIYIIFFISFFSMTSLSIAQEKNDEEQFKKRYELYKQVEATTMIPWYYIAAVDQYERSVRLARKDLPKPDGLTGIHFTREQWSGQINPAEDDTNPFTINLFNGMGVDGNGDGKAVRTNDKDVLYAFAHHILHYGMDEENFRLALWDFYQRDKAVGIIMGNAKLYKKFDTLALNKKVFPLPKNYNYTYRSTWGYARGWGGRRIHEGTDIFADYGVPVRSTVYGVIEMKGWNKYGGWRVGIRDINNVYHYFAHLNGFEKGLKIGQIVEPGTVIGAVGSTGYGPPGTSGKFPPHLHYGMYKDNGMTEWSFDPYPHLRAAEKNDSEK